MHFYQEVLEMSAFSFPHHSQAVHGGFFSFSTQKCKDCPSTCLAWQILKRKIRTTWKMYIKILCLGEVSAGCSRNERRVISVMWLINEWWYPYVVVFFLKTNQKWIVKQTGRMGRTDEACHWAVLTLTLGLCFTGAQSCKLGALLNWAGAAWGSPVQALAFYRYTGQPLSCMIKQKNL